MKEFTCSAKKLKSIINSVYAPYSEDLIKEDLKSVNYVSIYTDASNHANIKIFPIVIRYWLPLIGSKIRVIDISEEKGETSQIIFELIEKNVKKFKLEKKVIAFCGDNAKVNFGGITRGGSNNIFQRIKSSINPNLIGVGCSAHISHNSLKNACEVLDFDIEHIIVKIYSHFYLYTVRTENLKQFCNEAEVEYNKLLGYSKTRFLALNSAIKRIIQLFEPLKCYFASLNNGERAVKAFFERKDAKFWLIFVSEQVFAILLISLACILYWIYSHLILLLRPSSLKILFAKLKATASQPLKY